VEQLLGGARRELIEEKAWDAHKSSRLQTIYY
jgi:hypothetical protein